MFFAEGAAPTALQFRPRLYKESILEIGIFHQHAPFASDSKSAKFQKPALFAPFRAPLASQQLRKTLEKNASIAHFNTPSIDALPAQIRQETVF